MDEPSPSSIRERQAASPQSEPGAPAAWGRKEQARSLESRRAILRAALVEFADKGFERASTRAIGERAGLHHTLIGYHFGTKELLWRATAEHFFAEIDQRFQTAMTGAGQLEAIDQVRRFVRSLLRFSIETPAFHYFMVRQSSEPGARLAGLMDAVVPPLRQDMLAAIVQAQADGDLPPGPPSLIFYMFVGVVSVPASLAPEIGYATGLDIQDEEVFEQYWGIVEQLIFRRKPFKPA